MPDKTYAFINESVLSKLKTSNISINERNFKQGESILEKGEVSSTIHIITKGEVRIFIQQERKVELAVLGVDQFFGEMSCLTGDPVSANVEAMTEVQTVSLNRDGMMLLMDEIPSFRMQMIEAMVNRIKTSNDRVLQEHSKSVMMMKLHEEEGQGRFGEVIGESEEIENVRKAIPKYKDQPAIIVAGERGTEKLAIARKIHEAGETKLYPFIVLNANQIELNSWESKILVAHDGTVVIEEAEILPSDVIGQLIALSKKVRLTFLASEKLPVELPIITIAPIRDRVADIPLIAKNVVEKLGATNPETAISEDANRMLTLYPYLANNVKELESVVAEAFILSEGRSIHSNHLKFGRERKPGERPKVALALGSGSAKGMAHIGVWKMLADEGIPIDIVTGTSIGSVVGGMIAYGLTYQEGAKIMNGLKWGQIVRPTIPLKSIVQNGPLVQLVRNTLGDVNIEDLKLPYAAVASELATGEAHIMKSGSLAHAISASTAIPAVMRPVNYQGKILVDGAVVHPVPAALARSMGADIVLAVNICKEPTSAGPVRHLMDSLMNTIDIMSAKIVRDELQLADVVIRPDFEGRSIKFKDFDFCMNAGMAASKEVMEMMKQKIGLNS